MISLRLRVRECDPSWKYSRRDGRARNATADAVAIVGMYGESRWNMYRPAKHMNRLSSGITRAALRLGLIGLIILGGWASEKNSYSVTGAQTSGVTMYVSGRDKWVPSGTSRILRIIGTENVISPGATPTVTFSPAPVAVNYVVVASLDGLTVSITVPAGTAPGPQQLSVTDGTITHPWRRQSGSLTGQLPIRPPR